MLQAAQHRRHFLADRCGSIAMDHARNSTHVFIVSFADFGCRPRLLWAGHGLPGVRRRGAALGAAVALLRFRDDFDEDTYDAILAGAPGRGGVYRRGGGPGARGTALPVPARAGDRLVPALTEAGFTF